MGDVLYRHCIPGVLIAIDSLIRMDICDWFTETNQELCFDFLFPCDGSFVVVNGGKQRFFVVVVDAGAGVLKNVLVLAKTVAHYENVNQLIIKRGACILVCVILKRRHFNVRQENTIKTFCCVLPSLSQNVPLKAADP